jgi:hypothetical protein
MLPEGTSYLPQRSRSCRKDAFVGSALARASSKACGVELRDLMGDGRRSKHLPTWYMDGYGYGFIGSLGISWGYSGAWDMMGYLTNNIQLLLYGGPYSAPI